MAENIFPNLENENLVASMNALKENENPETQNKFLQEAIQAKYFAPVDIINEDGTLLEGTGKMEIPQNAKFNFKLITNQKGEQFFPLFTDIDEFQKWSKSEKVKTIVVVFPQMASLVSKKPDAIAGFVINPMSHNMIFPKALLDDILKHAQQKQAEIEAAKNNETKVTVMLGKPNNIPDSVMNSISKATAKRPEINSAYFIMMKQGEQEHYLFVLDMSIEGEEAKKIADSLCASIRLFLTKFPVIAVPLNSPIGQNAPKVTEPFYTKG